MTRQESSSGNSIGNGDWFKTTHWSVVLDARGPAQAHGALSKLCQTYWQPLYAYIRRSGYKPEDAQDLTQEFFARLFEKNYLNAVLPEKGKFRSFLLMSLKRFMANKWDYSNRLKRGGGREIVSLDAQDTEARYRTEPVDVLSPDKAFEKQWALTLLDQVTARLRSEYEICGKSALYEVLKSFVSGDRLSYAEASQALQMSEATVRVNVCRMRQRYRELLRAQIAETVPSPELVDDEIRHLFSALS